MEVVDIPVGEIRVDREREEVDGSFESLVESIEREGLIHPLHVTPAPKGYWICTGRRRLRALRAMGKKTAPCVIRKASAMDARRIELTENLHRLELTALERSEAIAELVEIAKEQGTFEPEVPKRGPKKGAESRAKDEAASTSGTSRRSVTRAQKVASISEPAKKILRSTPAADNLSELERLSELPREEQASVATSMVVSGARVEDAVKNTRVVKRSGRQNWPEEFDPVMAKRRLIIQAISLLNKEKAKVLGLLRSCVKTGQMNKLKPLIADIEHKFRAIDFTIVEWAIPTGPCPYCDGKGCAECDMDGWAPNGMMRPLKKSAGKLKRWSP